MTQLLSDLGKRDLRVEIYIAIGLSNVERYQKMKNMAMRMSLKGYAW